MGDASAATGIIRRLGLGKVRRLNTSWMWVQEKEVSREIQCHNHSADFFTKEVDRDSIRRHTESLGSEFVFLEGSTCILSQQYRNRDQSMLSYSKIVSASRARSPCVSQLPTLKHLNSNMLGVRPILPSPTHHKCQSTCTPFSREFRLTTQLELGENKSYIICVCNFSEVPPWPDTPDMLNNHGDWAISPRGSTYSFKSEQITPTVTPTIPDRSEGFLSVFPFSIFHFSIFLNILFM